MSCSDRRRRRRLFQVRLLHTAIYAVMASSAVIVLYAGVSGHRGWWLWPALTFIVIESVVFLGFGFRCPLTAVVSRLNDGGAVSDTLMPQRLTRHTFKVFGPIVALGLLLLAARWLFGCWPAG